MSKFLIPSKLTTPLKISHIVIGLKSVVLTAESPWKKEPKLKGACAKGKTYERTIFRRLKEIFKSDEIHYGQWFRFEDSSGWHYAQPDIYLISENKIFLLEIKRTQTDTAAYQLAGLYRPLLKFLYPDKEIIMIQVCKNLRYPPKNEISRLRDAKMPGIIYTYNCLGDVFNV